MVDALPSNAGDRYHFVYTAMKMLQIIDYTKDLELISVENVSKEDVVFSDSDDTFLGVDTAEYYGGRDAKTARKIRIIQVKYSSSSPQLNWTLKKLTTNKKGMNKKEKPGTSVLRKLANVFDYYYKIYGVNVINKLEIIVHTNQNIQHDLKDQIEEIKLAINEDLTKSSEILNKIGGKKKILINDLKTITKLNYKKLAAFLLCWNLSGFGQAMLSKAESELFDATNPFSSNSDIDIDRLISFVQEHAIPKRKTEITKEEVYKVLKLRESDFFPAKYFVKLNDNTIITKNIKHIAGELSEARESLYLLSGISGTGKTTALKVLKEQFFHDTCIIYDCYSQGSFGSERFDYRNCFVQIINELNYLLHTNILTTRKLTYFHLLSDFQDSIIKSAKIAENKGKKLIIGIDAIDSAYLEAQKHPLNRSNYFLPLLLNYIKEWVPKNCVFIFSARSENISLNNIEIEDSFKVCGFNETETKEFILSYWVGLEEKDFQLIYETTSGNPRVLSLLIEERKNNSETEINDFIRKYARSSAIDYYKLVCPTLLDSDIKKEILGFLLESSITLNMNDLILFSGFSERELKNFLELLNFGISVEGECVIWKNQDFYDYAKESLSDTIDSIKLKISDFCQINFNSNEYATHFLSYHFYQVGLHRELFDWWFENRRIQEYIYSTEPFKEDSLNNLRYLLLSTINLKDFKSSLMVLINISGIISGKDVFFNEILKEPSIDADSPYFDKFLRFFDEKVKKFSDVSKLIEIARVTSNNKNLIDIGSKILNDAFDLVDSQRSRFPQSNHGYNREDILNIALFDANEGGFQNAINNMKKWNPQKNILPVYAKFAYSHEFKSDQTYQTIKSAIKTIELEDIQYSFILFGLGTNFSISFTDADFERNHNQIISFLKKGLLNLQDLDELIQIYISRLLKNEKLRFTIQQFLTFWDIPEPNNIYSTEISNYLFKKAILEIANGKTFETAKYKKNTKKDDGNIHRIRELLDFYYPGVLIYVKTLVNSNDTSLVHEINEFFHNLMKNYWLIQQYPLMHFRQIVKNLFQTILEIKFDCTDCLEKIYSGWLDLDFNFDLSLDFLQLITFNFEYHSFVERKIVELEKKIENVQMSSKKIVQIYLKLHRITMEFDALISNSFIKKARKNAGKVDGNVSGLIFALIESGRKFQKSRNFDENKIIQLCKIFEYLKSISSERDYDRFGEGIRFIAEMGPVLAIKLNERIYKQLAVDYRNNFPDILLGMLRTNELAPSDIILFIDMLKGNKTNLKFLLQACILKLEESGADYCPILRIYLDNIRHFSNTNDIPREISDFLSWINQNSIDCPEIITLSTKIENIMEGRESKKIQKQDSEVVQEEETLLIKNLKALVGKREKLELLANLTSLEIRNIPYLDFIKIFNLIYSFLEQSTSKEKMDIIYFIEKWSTKNVRTMGVDRILKMAVDMPASTEYGDKIYNVLFRLMDVNTLQQMCSDYSGYSLENFLKSSLLNKEQKIMILISSVNNDLTKVDSFTLLKIIGYISNFLEPEDSFEIFNKLLEKPLSLTSSIVEYNHTDKTPFEFLIIFLSNKLGHPSLSIRWDTLHVLKSIILEHPKVTLQILMEEMDDIKHERWLTKKEWLSFLFHHISVIQPLIFKDYINILAKNLLDSNFPHVKFRYHIKSVLYNYNNNTLEMINEALMEQIKKINTPIGYIKEKRRNLKPYSGKTWRSRSFTKPFFFDTIDTLPYWYAPLAHCFNLHRCDVADLSFKWITKKWNITTKKCDDDNKKWKDIRSRDENVRNDHGSEPSFELLHIYAERHGMFMAAGELITSKKASSLENFSNWDDWLKYRVQGADPSVISRLIIPPPINNENLGVFTEDLEKWLQKESAISPEERLFVDGLNDWIIITGESHGNFDRYFTYEVESALVNSDTGRSLMWMINNENEILRFPYNQLEGYTTSIADIEKVETFSRNEIVELNGIFQLKPWITYYHQELPLHYQDTRYPEDGRHYYFPSKEFSDILKIRRNPFDLKWIDEKGELVSYFEFWHKTEGKSRHSYFSDGYRLVMKKSAIDDILEKKNMDLIFYIRCIRRTNSWNGRGNTEKKMQINFALIYSQNGEFLSE
jgi:DNA polymerase III delta prime subunit